MYALNTLGHFCLYVLHVPEQRLLSDCYGMKQAHDNVLTVVQLPLVVPLFWATCSSEAYVEPAAPHRTIHVKMNLRRTSQMGHWLFLT